MSFTDKHRRLLLIKLRAKILRAKEKGLVLPELVLLDEAADESEPLDMVDMLDMGLVGAEQ